MFRKTVPYKEAVVSENPNLNELSRRTARTRDANEGGHYNYAARSALRENQEPVYSTVLRSQGKDLGPSLHPDRTTEIALYNKLISDPKNKGEWLSEGFKPIKRTPQDLKTSLSSPEESNKLLEQHRRKFYNLGYRTQLFSELHPCSDNKRTGDLGCDPYLRETLNPEIDEVYHSVPYKGFGSVEDRLNEAHLGALEAMKANPSGMPAPLLPDMSVLPDMPVVEYYQPPSSLRLTSTTGPIDQFLSASRAPYNIPSVVKPWVPPPTTAPQGSSSTSDSLLNALKSSNKKQKQPEISPEDFEEMLGLALSSKGPSIPSYNSSNRSRSLSPNPSTTRYRERSPSPVPDSEDYFFGSSNRHSALRSRSPDPYPYKRGGSVKKSKEKETVPTNDKKLKVSTKRGNIYRKTTTQCKPVRPSNKLDNRKIVKPTRQMSDIDWFARELKAYTTGSKRL